MILSARFSWIISLYPNGVISQAGGGLRSRHRSLASAPLLSCATTSRAPRPALKQYICTLLEIAVIGSGPAVPLINGPCERSRVTSTPPQSGHNPVTVLLGHANDQLLNLSLDPRPAG